MTSTRTYNIFTFSSPSLLETLEYIKSENRLDLTKKLGPEKRLATLSRSTPLAAPQMSTLDNFEADAKYDSTLKLMYYTNIYFI